MSVPQEYAPPLRKCHSLASPLKENVPSSVKISAFMISTYVCNVRSSKVNSLTNWTSTCINLYLNRGGLLWSLKFSVFRRTNTGSPTCLSTSERRASLQELVPLFGKVICAYHRHWKKINGWEGGACYWLNASWFYWFASRKRVLPILCQ